MPPGNPFSGDTYYRYDLRINEVKYDIITIWYTGSMYYVVITYPGQQPIVAGTTDTDKPNPKIDFAIRDPRSPGITLICNGTLEVKDPADPANAYIEGKFIMVPGGPFPGDDWTATRPPT